MRCCLIRLISLRREETLSYLNLNSKKSLTRCCLIRLICLLKEETLSYLSLNSKKYLFCAAV